MVNTQLQGILKEFETYFNCPLVTDEQESCLIKMSIGVDVQIEINRYGAVLIGCRLGSVLGKYRDQLFKEAMKSNYLFPPHTGVFGYSQKSKNLILFILVDSKNINTEIINELLTPFIAKAKIWIEAIKSNSVPLIKEGGSSKTSDNLFGIRS
jgi:hypothetical protein